MSIIKIRKGDEYRARIGNVCEKDAFFYDVYQQAILITKELADHVEKNKKKEESDGIQYRIGNNIISFCGQRGQGKTSAMQTFSYFLKTKDNGKKTDVECELLKDKYFCVLSSIDPSSLRTDESIVRVMLSKLFNDTVEFFDQYYENNPKEKTIDTIRVIKDRIMGLFEECFRNVDYSVKENRDDYGMDNLELLAQLGSSNMLRNNLKKLVDTFLELKSKYGKEEKNYQFLIVQIDDSDMALDGIFKMCEDIRNYFSLPNIIVLMAADIKQLTNAITAEYVNKYKDLINTEFQRGSSSNRYLDNCKEMGNRYIEKMFPAGHRIGLPAIDAYIKWNFEETKIQYKYMDEQGKDMFGQYAQECSDIQEQLLRALYERTGLIFKKNSQILHFILPTTLRELTHFVRILDDMYIVNFKEAFKKKCKETSHLQHNLDLFENYFWNYWCRNNLTDNELNEMAILNRKMLLEEVDKLENMDCVRDTDVKSKLRYARIIFYSIFMNKRFIELVENENAYDSLISLLRKSFLDHWNDIEINRSNEYGLKVLHYHFVMPQQVNLRGIDMEKQLLFCDRLVDENYVFDMTRGLLNILYEQKAIVEKRRNATEGQTVTLSSDSGEVSSSLSEPDKKQGDIHDPEQFALRLIGLKNIFANCEIYAYITSEIQRYFSDISIEAFFHLCKVYENFFNYISVRKYDIDYLNLPRKEVEANDYWYKSYDSQKDLYCQFFWENIKREEDKKEKASEEGKIVLKSYESLIQIYQKRIVKEYDQVIEKLKEGNTDDLLKGFERLNTYLVSDEYFIKHNELEEIKEAFDYLRREVDQYCQFVGSDALERNASPESQKGLQEFKVKLQEKLDSLKNKWNINDSSEAISDGKKVTETGEPEEKAEELLAECDQSCGTKPAEEDIKKGETGEMKTVDTE